MGRRRTAESPCPDGFYVIQKIVGKRMHEGLPEYLIKWLNFPSETNTWEPVENLISSYHLVTDYERRCNLKAKKIHKHRPMKKTTLVDSEGSSSNSSQSEVVNLIVEPKYQPKVTKGPKFIEVSDSVSSKSLVMERDIQPQRLVRSHPKRRPKLSTEIGTQISPGEPIHRRSECIEPSDEELERLSVAEEMPVQQVHNIQDSRNSARPVPSEPQSNLRIEETPPRMESVGPPLRLEHAISDENSMPFSFSHLSHPANSLCQLQSNSPSPQTPNKCKNCNFHPSVRIPAGKLDLSRYIKESQEFLSRGRLFSISSVLMGVQLQDPVTNVVTSNFLVSAESLKNRGSELINQYFRKIFWP